MNIRALKINLDAYARVALLVVHEDEFALSDLGELYVGFLFWW